ncbi:hypothetical protein DFR52_101272 [Hoeflea marina]|uniref:Uncharacterized protein n=1 Tax=Hoeflea marina TaxID=274592 RepID=A0A317PRL1_9HYPH|nr:hypothetical protein DFR52_101272 [Hoeflea marina]
MPQPMSWSAAKKKIAATNTMTSTMTVEIMVSRCDGHTTFAVSARTCCKNVIGLFLDAIACPRLYGAYGRTSSPTRRVSDFDYI